MVFRIILFQLGFFSVGDVIFAVCLLLALSFVFFFASHTQVRVAIISSWYQLRSWSQHLSLLSTGHSRSTMNLCNILPFFMQIISQFLRFFYQQSERINNTLCTRPCNSYLDLPFFSRAPKFSAFHNSLVT